MKDGHASAAAKPFKVRKGRRKGRIAMQRNALVERKVTIIRTGGVRMAKSLRRYLAKSGLAASSAIIRGSNLLDFEKVESTDGVAEAALDWMKRSLSPCGGIEDPHGNSRDMPAKGIGF